jgi:hypothetical protein
MTLGADDPHGGDARARLEEAFAALLAAAPVTAPVVMDGPAGWLEGELTLGGSGAGLWVSAGDVLPVEPVLAEGSYRIGALHRPQPPLLGDEGPKGPLRLEALDWLFAMRSGSAPTRWEPARIGGEPSAPVWKQAMLVDPESIPVDSRARSEQWLHAMGWVPGWEPTGAVVVSEAGGPPASIRTITGPLGEHAVARLRASEYLGAAASPDAAVTGADLIAWVGLEEGSGPPVAVAIDVGEGMRRRASRFVAVPSAWDEPVGPAVGRPRVGQRIEWHYPFSEQFVGGDDGHDHDHGHHTGPSRIGTVRYPSGRIAIAGASLGGSMATIDLRVPGDRDLPCFAVGPLSKQPTLLIRIADGRPARWHIALDRGGTPLFLQGGNIPVLGDADLLQRVSRGSRRPSESVLNRVRFHTPGVLSLSGTTDDAVCMNIVSPMFVVILGVDDGGAVVALSVLANHPASMVRGPDRLVGTLAANRTAQARERVDFVVEEGFAASMPFIVADHHDHHHHGEAGTGSDGDDVEGGRHEDDEPARLPPGFDQERFDLYIEHLVPHDRAMLCVVLAAASRSRTPIHVARYADGWRWSVAAREGAEAVQRAAAEFTGIEDGALTSEGSRYGQVESGWWVITEHADGGWPSDAPERVAVIEFDGEVDSDGAARLLHLAIPDA